MENFLTKMRTHCAQNPAIQTVLNKSNFVVAAAVETDVKVLDFGHAYASSQQIQSGWFRAIRASDERILWLFEDYDEAVQFVMKFGGVFRGARSVASWQRHPLCAPPERNSFRQHS